MKSAEVVVPLVFKLLKPESVVDVGCGTGSWLFFFKKCGTKEVLGIDGMWVNPKSLQISEHEFRTMDIVRPQSIGRKFDLVVCMEVAEHLPPRYADTFVDFLISLGPVVLFSAAIPHQGGTHHVNEQWQDYWAKKFQSRGYVVLDCVRPRIWWDERVESFYRQNSLVFIQYKKLADFPSLQRSSQPSDSLLSVVHPDYYLRSFDKRAIPARGLIAAFLSIPWIINRAVRRLVEA